jgi:agmatine/peptidylarginine deiminase
MKKKKRRNYKWRQVRNHPLLGTVCCYEHKIVAVEKLGRLLHKNEVVHHIDDDWHNNAPDNLQIVANATHTSMHMKGKPKSKLHIARAGRAKRGNSYYANFVKRNGHQIRPKISEENKRRWASGVFDNMWKNRG